MAAADLLHQRLGAGRVLHDDTEDSPGSEFAKADLLGMPIRLTVSPGRSRPGAEVSRRAAGSKQVVPIDEVAQSVHRLLTASATV